MLVSIRKLRKRYFLPLACSFALLACSGNDGSDGTSRALVTGRVSNSLTYAPVDEVTVTTEPAIEGTAIATDASGNYQAWLPIGAYRITFAKEYFRSSDQTLTLVAGQTAERNVELVPDANVIIEVPTPGKALPGEVLTLSADVDVMDGSTIQSIAWTRNSGAEVLLFQEANSPNASATLLSMPSYKARLLSLLNGRRDQPDRFGVMGLTAADIQNAGRTNLGVTVETSSGVYTKEVALDADIGQAMVPNPGLANVPLGFPVILRGKAQALYAWEITSKPEGSAASLDSPLSQYPTFTPDLAGAYVVAETQSGALLEIYAATAVGLATRDAEGSTAEDCASCHNGSAAPAMGSVWQASGHSKAFARRLNNDADFGEACLSCHAVGVGRGAGFSGDGLLTFLADTAFFSGGTALPSANNWVELQNAYPGLADYANVQCENCHGPQQEASPGSAHQRRDARVSLSAAVCVVCHSGAESQGIAEQWQETNHASYQVAIDEASVEVRGARAYDCARCHTGQGFIAWSRQENSGLYLQGASGNATIPELTALGITRDSVHPITCAVCHDPHDTGSTLDEAKVRMDGNVPMLQAGYGALGVGSGAICIACHNSRVGLHNDNQIIDAFVVKTAMNDRSQHVSQADVMLGQNAFFVSVGQRAPHSLLKDTCVNCHMKRAAASAGVPAAASHTLKAAIEICADCHGVTDGEAFQTAIQAEMDNLQNQLRMAIEAEVAAQLAAGNSITLKDWAGTKVLSTITAANVVEIMDPRPYMGYASVDVRVDGTLYEMLRLGNSMVVTGVGVPAGTNLLSSPAGQVIAKAIWNYGLLVTDKSKGVHNPGFATEVISATSEALRQL